MAGLGDLVIKMSLDMATFEADTARAASAAEKAAHDIGLSIGTALRTVATLGAAAAAAIGSAGALMAKIAISVQQQVDALDEAAQAAGVAADQFQKLQYAFSLSGVSADKFNVMMRTLNVEMAKAASGNAKAQEAFERLGISVTDAAGNMKSADEVLAELNTAFQAMPDGPEKVALAVKLLGRSGAEAIPALNASLQELSRTAEEVGAVFSDELIAASRDYEVQTAKLDLALQGVRNVIAEGMLQALADFKSAMFDIAAEMLSVENRTEAVLLLQDRARIFFKSLAVWAAFAVDALASLRDIASTLSGTLDAVFTTAGEAGAALNRKLFGTAEETAKHLKNISDAWSSTGKKLQDMLGRESLHLKVAAKFDEASAEGAVRRAAEVGKIAMERMGRELGLEAIGRRPPPTPPPKAGRTGKTKAAKRDMAEELGVPQWEIDEAEMANKASEQFLRVQHTFNEKLAKDQEKWEEERTKDAIKAVRERTIYEIEENEKKQRELDRIARKEEERMRREQERFREAFTDSFSDSLTDAVEGTKSLSDAFKDMTDSIVHSLNRIAAGKIAESIFGSSTPSGSTSGLAGTAMQAMASWFMGGGGGGGMPFYGGGGTPAPFANGGSFRAGQPILVGERGPELIVPSRGGSVIPNGSFGGNVNVTVNVPPITDRRTADQAAASVGLAVQRAMRRNQ